jgi:hypothetical protein
MIITPSNLADFNDNPIGFIENMMKNRDKDDTKLIFAKKPVIEDYPKEEGIFYIYNKLSKLEDLSTQNIAENLLDYHAFMKKHNIQIIKEYDNHCKLVYQGEIPHIKVQSFETQSFYGFNKFQIISAETLVRKDEKNILFVKGIDFTYALDSNAASNFERYFINKDDRYKSLYDEIMDDKNNIDITPYIFETIMHGLNDFGINYKLNKKNTNTNQAGFFQTISSFCKAEIFEEKKIKTCVNKIIKATNPLINFYGSIGYSSKIFLILMLEAKYKFSNSPNKIKNYVYSELRKEKLPIENRLKSILYLFAENPGHRFFEKVINIKGYSNLEDYLNKVDNTARDIAISLLEKYFYANLNIFPFLATDDRGFIQMLHETKADYIFKYDEMEIPVYKNINKDIQRKYLEFFETDLEQNTVKYQDTSLKNIMLTYKNRLSTFIELIKK